eukprot:TRINITY_DN65617_c0_g1_i1.p1 TRINITY_DN65617_c0_g1~~TRINITY_DN65617_c0_g1_i1.p1  ORF type:complete len:355 (+),score=100.28 TRINITY_DN65617_c0_g1_i1:66-1130(+)
MGDRAKRRKAPPPPRDAAVAALRQELLQRGGEQALLDAAEAAVPHRWERHGAVVTVRLPQSAVPPELVGAALRSALCCRLVLLDGAGVGGELREPQQCRVLAGDPTTVAEHNEGGILYRFDAAAIMFSSGNTTERMHMGTLGSGEVVVDMFAGIGYFTLPVARHGGARVVHALEKNPLSARFLAENAAVNGVASVVRCWPGDNREVAQAAVGTADRVLMGYFDGGEDARPFLRRAVEFLRRDAAGRPQGVLHYHFLATAGEAWAKPCGDVRAELGVRCAPGRRSGPRGPGSVRYPCFPCGADCFSALAAAGCTSPAALHPSAPGWEAVVTEVRRVKAYRPKVWHYVADVSIGRR